MLQTIYLLNCKQPDVFQIVETVVQILVTLTVTAVFTTV